MREHSIGNLTDKNVTLDVKHQIKLKITVPNNEGLAVAPLKLVGIISKILAKK